MLELFILSMLVKSEISSQNFHSCFFFDLSFRLSYLFLKLQRFCMISDIMLDFLINRLCSSLLLSIRTDLWYCDPFSVYFLDLLQSPSTSSSSLFSISWWLSVWSATTSSFVLVKSSTHLSNPSLIDIFLIKSIKLSTFYYLL